MASNMKDVYNYPLDIGDLVMTEFTSRYGARYAIVIGENSLYSGVKYSSLGVRVYKVINPRPEEDKKKQALLEDYNNTIKSRELKKRTKNEWVPNKVYKYDADENFYVISLGKVKDVHNKTYPLNLVIANNLDTQQGINSIKTRSCTYSLEELDKLIPLAQTISEAIRNNQPITLSMNQLLSLNVAYTDERYLAYISPITIKVGLPVDAPVLSYTAPIKVKELEQGNKITLSETILYKNDKIEKIGQKNIAFKNTLCDITSIQFTVANTRKRTN